MPRRRCNSPFRTASCSIPPRANGSRAACRPRFTGCSFAAPRARACGSSSPCGRAACYRLGLAGKLPSGGRSRLFLSWVALFYSLSLRGLGYQTGLAPWWHWVRGRPLPPRSFEPVGVPLLPPPRLSGLSRTRLADAGRHARSGRADRPVDRLRLHRKLPQRRTPFGADRRALSPLSRRGAGLSLPQSTRLARRQSSKSSAALTPPDRPMRRFACRRVRQLSHSLACPACWGVGTASATSAFLGDARC